MPAILQDGDAANSQIDWQPVHRGGPHNHIVRRRPTPQQGQALELLGHAVEYLVDSRLHLGSGSTRPADDLAVQLLMRLNREVFAECPPIVPLGARLRQWFRR